MSIVRLHPVEVRTDERLSWRDINAIAAGFPCAFESLEIRCDASKLRQIAGTRFTCADARIKLGVKS